MSNHHCDMCDKTIKKRYKNKHLNTRLHRGLSISIINKYHVKNPKIFEKENILKKYILENKKKLTFTIIYVNGN